MREYFFANYRLVTDDEMSGYKSMKAVSVFEHELPYVHTFRLHMGDSGLLDEKYEQAVGYPLLCRASQVEIHKADEGFCIIVPKREHKGNMLQYYVLECTGDYSGMTLYASDNSVYIAETDRVIEPDIPLLTLIRVACETGMIFHDGFAIHASLVEKNGEGILFLGPSGIGKSTQGMLWEKYQDAEFINGDRPGICLLGDKWYACGMPWDGKDKVYKQFRVPIKACVYLEQAKENSVEGIDYKGSVAALLKQILLPMWDDEAVNLVTQMLTRFAAEVPFYHLKNRADEAATQLVYDMIWGKK